ncbi:MAG: hemerythrin domain-containing protein [Betaproteobacteria bacterium]|nr:hemerythrin domain-containing protein [Betaproteobacteria bacterium]
MADPITEWHDEHARFGRLLDLLETQAMAFHAGEEPNYDLMRDVIHYLRHFADRFHHPREDVAFARLAERDPGLRLAVSRLLQEHRVITVTGEELLRRLDDIAADVVVERSAVEAAAVIFLVYYRHHLATEETEIVPRAAELLTPDDWAAVTAAVPTGRDPLFGDDVEARYEELSRQLKL